MSWNRTNEKTVEKKGGQRNVHLKGLIAGVIVVLGAGLAAWLLMSGEADSRPLQKKERGLIKEVTPAAAPKTTEEADAKAKRDRQRRKWWDVDASQTNGFSPVQLRIWKYYKNPPSYTNTTSLTMPKARYAIFPTAAENAIACLLTLEPGQTLVGPAPHGKKFTDEFLKSCETPIIVEEGDDEFTAELKREMNQTKIELRQRMAEGEDLGQILADARKENLRLAEIKREIETQVRDMVRAAKSEVEADDAITAANKLLEAKGIAPIDVNPIIKRKFMHMLKKK